MRKLMILFVAVQFISCSPVMLKKATISDFKLQHKGESILGPAPYKSSDWEAYQTSWEEPLFFPTKYVRVNMHYVDNSDSSYSFHYREGVTYAHNLLKEANRILSENNKMFLPMRNHTPVLPTNYRYKLTTSKGYEKNKGIYWHYDDENFGYIHKGKDKNIGDRTVINKYGIGKDSICNIFLMAHDPAAVALPTYNVRNVGVAFGVHTKVAGIVPSDPEPWKQRGILNHEMGHVVGLPHSWRKDGCDDTPEHKNDCYGKKNDGSRCDSLASNNVMGYNNWQSVWTPCQIGKIQKRMNDPNSRIRKYLIKNWCTYHPDSTIFINKTVRWFGQRDLIGDVVINRGGTLEIASRVSFPKGAKIVVKDGGRLVLTNARLHNDCGEKWEGILFENKKGKESHLIIQGDISVENTVNEFTQNKIGD